VLTLWTDDVEVARSADAAGVDRVGLDLETLGKQERQHGRGTWISPHSVDRLPALRDALGEARLFTRVNPVHPRTPEEVERVIGGGAEVLMLPMFRGAGEVERFVETVGDRAEVVLLLETREAAERIEDIASVDGIGEVHVGINDLAIELGLRSRFDVYDSRLVEHASDVVRASGMRFGIGGLGRVDDRSLPLPSRLLYAQYARLGATSALISRAFMASRISPERLRDQVARTRAELSRWFDAGPDALARAHRDFRHAVAAMPRW
jgi:2-keto-3-deoxy-L-rhamnonate aldolase RhmA